MPSSSSPASSLTLRLLPTTALVFSGYLIVGLEAATVPSFVHRELGLSPLMAGCALSAQFAATLINRPFAGSMTDRMGARRTVLVGLLVCGLASLLFAGAAPHLWHSSRMSWLCIVLSRLLLGVAISWVSTAGTVWGIGRVTAAHTAQVVAWSGVASYGSLALGAPLGFWAQGRFGIQGLGLAMAGLAVLAALLGSLVVGTPAVPGTPLHFRAVLARVAPFGMTLALAASGFGCFLALTTLFFESRGWAGAAVPLTVYGVCFVAVRLTLARQVDRLGAYPVALLSITMEIAGLLLLASATGPGPALVASALIGAGFSLVFPALCVEALSAVQPRNGASAVSLYTGFIELSFALTSPGAGLLAERVGFRVAFACAAGLATCALLATVWLRRASASEPRGIPVD